MKVFKILGVIIGLIIVGILILYAIGPKKVYMERSIEINASPAAVYDELNSFETFNQWSPWYKKDTLAEYTMEGPAYGPGAHFSWSSQILGDGSMTIDSVHENKIILNRMNFGFGDSYARYIIEEQEDQTGTKLTWTYEENPAFQNRIIYAFVDIEDMIGSDYEEGLRDFKTFMEAKSARDTDLGIEVVETEPITYLGIQSAVVNSSAVISTQMEQLYNTIMSYMNDNEIEAIGMPLAIYTQTGKDSVEMICGVPVPEGTTEDHGEIMMQKLDAGKAVRAVHTGDYKNLPTTYESVNSFIANNNLKGAGLPYEVYVTDPTQVTDTSQWVTHVFYPVEK